MKNIIFLSENFHFLVVKFSEYLNRRVFVTRLRWANKWIGCSCITDVFWTTCLSHSYRTHSFHVHRQVHTAASYYHFVFTYTDPICCPLSKLDSFEIGLTYSRLRKDIPLDYSQRREGVFIIIPRCIHLSKIMVKSRSPSAHLDIIREGYSY